MNTELYSRFEVIPVSPSKPSHPCLYSSASDPVQRLFASSCSPSFEWLSLDVAIYHFDMFVFKGDINEKQRSSIKMEKKIEDMLLKCGGTNVEHEENLAAVQQDIQTIRDNIQVGAGAVAAQLALLEPDGPNSLIIGAFFPRQGDQSGAVAVPKEARRGGEDGPEGEESQPGGPEVHQAGVGSDGRKQGKVRPRPEPLLLVFFFDVNVNVTSE